MSSGDGKNERTVQWELEARVLALEKSLAAQTRQHPE